MSHQVTKTTFFLSVPFCPLTNSCFVVVVVLFFMLGVRFDLILKHPCPERRLEILNGSRMWGNKLKSNVCSCLKAIKTSQNKYKYFRNNIPAYYGGIWIRVIVKGDINWCRNPKWPFQKSRKPRPLTGGTYRLLAKSCIFQGPVFQLCWADSDLSPISTQW